MAHHKILVTDPALVKLDELKRTRSIYFRWTPRTARLTFIYVGVVPVMLGYLLFQTDGKWNFRAKRKGDLISER